VYFHITPADIMSTVMGTFRSRPLPPIDDVARKTVSAKGVTVDIPTSWAEQPGRSFDAKTERILIVGGIEGAAWVDRTTDTKLTIHEETERVRQLAETAPGAGSVRTSTATLAGQPAIRLDYIATKRDPRFVMAPGFRRIYLIHDGNDAVVLYLSGPDTARADELLDQIASSFALR
jgi:hypothetical protein